MYFYVPGREGGTSVGPGRALTGEVGKRSPERTAWVWDIKTGQPGRARVRSPLESAVAHDNQLRAK